MKTNQLRREEADSSASVAFLQTGQQHREETDRQEERPKGIETHGIFRKSRVVNLICRNTLKRHLPSHKSAAFAAAAVISSSGFHAENLRVCTRNSNI